MKKHIAMLAFTALFAGTLTAEVTVSGKSFLRLESPFQSASPERVALAAHHAAQQHKENDHCGNIQFTVFGGRNAKRSEAAAYYMPGGHQTLTFDGAVTTTTYTTSLARNITQIILPNQIDTSAGGGTAAVAGATSITKVTVDDGPTQFDLEGDANAGNTPEDEADGLFMKVAGSTPAVASMIFDSNREENVIRPWNFGITFGALIDPEGNAGAGSVTNPQFKSTISPELVRMHWGVGAAWRQHLSEEQTGFWVEASSAIQRVKQEMKLNEEVETERLASGSYTAAVTAAWTAQGYPVGDDAPANVTEAFAQEAWLYGKIDGAQSKTRLADLELKLGYNFVAEDNYSSAGYAGFVIPAGNKAEAVYMAEPIVGNGKHFGLMLGSNSHMMLSSSQDMNICFRCDADARYLLRNTQTRSFDVKGKEWSRYMMVWESWDKFNGAGAGAERKDWSPGINVFTEEVHVTPRAQARLNQAFHLESGSFRGELGWNIMARQSEKVELAEAWDKKVVFADPNSDEKKFNLGRTIYNDSNLTTNYNVTETDYNTAAITEEELNLQSAASPMALTNTPYISLGYDWEDGYFGLGGSYEFSKDNSYNNNWMLWGKLGFSF